MIFTDRSRVEVGQGCPRKRYFAYHHGGMGVTPRTEGADLTFGKAVHAAIEIQNHSLLLPPPLINEGVVTADGFSQSLEWASLYEGLTTTFRLDTLPRMKEEFDWVSSEEEITITLPGGVNWMTRLDGVLRRKTDGMWFVLEAKTTSWMDSLAKAAPFNFQLLMEIESCRRHYSLSPAEMGGALLLVFDKGQSRRASFAEQKKGVDGYRRLSPFTYWYQRERVTGVEYRLDYASGWERTPTWAIPDWWEIGWERFGEEFKQTVQLWPSVSFDPIQTEKVIEQVVEQELALSRPSSNLDATFPQFFKNCTNDGGFRKMCPFIDACFNRVDPLTSEEFVERVPNHPQERRC